MRYMYAKHPKMAKEFAKHTKNAKSLPEKAHHSGKGTRSRLNTAAEKTLFRSHYSD